MQVKTWNKRDIMPKIGSKDYKLLLGKLEKNVKFIEGYRLKLKPDIFVKDFMDIIKIEEKIVDMINRLGAYAFLWFSEDTTNQKAISFRSTVEQVAVDAGNRTMFFNLWFKNLDDKNAKRIIDEVPNEYKYLFSYMRILKPYILSEPEEKIINIKDSTGVNTLNKLYDMITSKFVFTLTIDGKKKQLTQGELITYAKDPNPKIRKAAYQELYRVFSSEESVLAEIYRNIVLSWKDECITLRKYARPITVRNKSNDMSDKTVETLLKVCKKNKNIFQEYFKVKAKYCKIKDMSRYDIYAPYNKIEGKYSYEQAKKLIFDAYRNYSKEMYTLAKKVVDSSHIDYEIRKNKRTGAYCMYLTPTVVPYVLLNFDGKVRDVSTLAHELGHAVHALLTKHHSILTADPPLTLAETASVFGEMLLFESLMNQLKDNEAKKSLLIQKLDDTYATILRQAYFIFFEIEAHDLIAKGADLNELNKVYLENLKEQFGNSLVVSEHFKHEWIVIPHMYQSPFYCYAYAFGNLLVLALYEKYKKEGKSFVPKYIKLLSYGGSESPSKILKEVGIDIEDEKFWQGGFDLIKEMVNELKELK